jgi:hypothetical protein
MGVTITFIATAFVGADRDEPLRRCGVSVTSFGF